MRIRVFRDQDALAAAAAEEIASWLRFDERPTIGLAGGSTPRRTYEALEGADVPWSRVTAWMTDERDVPADHPDANVRMAREALFDRVPATLYEVPHVEGDPDAAASRYEETLHGILPVGSGGLTPGLVLLGVGDDGHTASLFPGSEALAEDRRGYLATWVPRLDTWRLTASLPLLAAARRTMFLAAGASKAEIVHEVLDLRVDHPATRLTDRARDAVWLLDREAAALLEREA
jgi:6-phosphogluconolactonase